MKELWRYALQRKKFFLFPFIIVLLALGLLMIVAQGSAVAPFIYAVF